MASIDLNCDMGESFGAWRMGNDREILEHVSSANIACGFHAGDPRTMRETAAAAIARGVAVGAHPGLPDLQGFGRRAMALSADEVYDIVLYQIGALAAFTRAAGGRLAHVKAHGALYNMAARDRTLADALCAAVRDHDRALVLVGLAGSQMLHAARDAGLRAASEVFADRTYQDDGSLTPRGRPDALIEDVEASVRQVRRMVLDGVVRSVGGRDVPVQADTLCIHGDAPHAPEFARRVRAELERAGVRIRAVGDG